MFAGCRLTGTIDKRLTPWGKAACLLDGGRWETLGDEWCWPRVPQSGLHHTGPVDTITSVLHPPSFPSRCLLRPRSLLLLLPATAYYVLPERD